MTEMFDWISCCLFTVLYGQGQMRLEDRHHQQLNQFRNEERIATGSVIIVTIPLMNDEPKLNDGHASTGHPGTRKKMKDFLGAHPLSLRSEILCGVELFSLITNWCLYMNFIKIRTATAVRWSWNSFIINQINSYYKIKLLLHFFTRASYERANLWFNHFNGSLIWAVKIFKHLEFELCFSRPDWQVTFFIHW